MTEQKPEYKLEFVLTYDRGKSVTFSGSSDDLWAAWLASQEIPNLNNSIVSDRVSDRTEVTVNIYKDGRSLSRSDLTDEIHKHYQKLSEPRK